MKQRRSVCSGRRETSLRRQAKFLPGTANGHRHQKKQQLSKKVVVSFVLFSLHYSPSSLKSCRFREEGEKRKAAEQ
jgi:hypothetical protein